MEDVIDIRMALEQLGKSWQFGGSVTDGTQAAWDAVVWEDSRDKPMWEDLCAAYLTVPPAPTPPVVISSDTITIPDAELLMAAATAGDKTAEWLIAKLEL